MKLQIVPEMESRPETGPMRFGEDWPGVFIRGDNALYYGMMLEQYLEHNPPPDGLEMDHRILMGLAQTLSSCHWQSLKDQGEVA
jgi:hypothetical protein